MPELLTIATEDWNLTVWSRDIVGARNRLEKTLSKRDTDISCEGLRFNPPVDNSKVSGVDSSQPVFFENKVYEFDFSFGEAVDTQGNKPCVKHKLTLVEESFHSTKSGTLRGSINFGNDVGWFKLRLVYFKAGKPVEQSISFQVFATKMDMQTDLQGMLETIDATYPLWRYSLSEKTEQELAKSRKPHERFPLLWLAHFTQLRGQLETAIKRIVNQPHVRLLDISRTLRADKIRSRLRPRLEQNIAEDFAAGTFDKRYVVGSKRLSIDTPENQFIKMVLKKSVHTLTSISNAARDNNKAPEKQRLSPTFFDELTDWKKPLEGYLTRPFFREVSDYTDVSHESLVLHQKLGYSNVYRIWQQLKMYLDVLGNNASVSMKSIAELYEVWCLLEMRRILTEELGFIEVESRKAQLKNAALEKSMVDGVGAAFRFERGDGVKVFLAHEPKFGFSTRKTDKILSYTATQVPDIFMEAEFPGGDTINWIFDAKYRIADDENDSLVPDDAINQMHRYRDALIYLHKEDAPKKSRPILGAYVLYPGYIDEASSNNYYQNSIEEVGIGAFPLLPGRPNIWLLEFLRIKLRQATNYPYASADRMYVEDSARIAFKGMQVHRDTDLTLLGITASRSSRTPDYMRALDNGTAKWFHTPCSTVTTADIEANLIHEVAFVCPTYPRSADGNSHAEFAYPVVSVKKMLRSELSIEQTGSITSTRMDQEYWIFELGASRKLNNPIMKSDFKSRIIMTSYDELNKHTEWKELPKKYRFFEPA